MRYFSAGDVVTFSMNVTRQTQAVMIVQYGLANSNGAFVQNASFTSNNNSALIERTMVVQQSGTYHIRIRNASATILTTSNGMCRHHWGTFQHNFRIRYDTFANSYGIHGMWADFNQANWGITENFGIRFNMNGNIDLSPALIVGNCWCVAHDYYYHADANVLLGIEQVPGFHTLRFSGRELCRNGEAIAGSGEIGGTESIVTTASKTMWGVALDPIIQEELSHNLGATHARCNTNNEICLLKRSYINSNRWCSTCTFDIYKLR